MDFIDPLTIHPSINLFFSLLLWLGFLNSKSINGTNQKTI